MTTLPSTMLWSPVGDGVWTSNGAWISPDGSQDPATARYVDTANLKMHLDHIRVPFGTPRKANPSKGCPCKACDTPVRVKLEPRWEETPVKLKPREEPVRDKIAGSTIYPWSMVKRARQGLLLPIIKQEPREHHDTEPGEPLEVPAKQPLGGSFGEAKPVRRRLKRLKPTREAEKAPEIAEAPSVLLPPFWPKPSDSGVKSSQVEEPKPWTLDETQGRVPLVSIGSLPLGGSGPDPQDEWGQVLAMAPDPKPRQAPVSAVVTNSIPTPCRAKRPSSAVVTTEAGNSTQATTSSKADDHDFHAHLHKLKPGPPAVGRSWFFSSSPIFKWESSDSLPAHSESSESLPRETQ